MKKSCGYPCVEDSGRRLRAVVHVYYGPSPQTILSGYTVDIRTGGLFLQTEFPLRVEKLTMIFSLPNQGSSVSCQVRVAWVNHEEGLCKPELPLGVGLQFVDLSLKDLMVISTFIENSETEAAW